MSIGVCPRCQQYYTYDGLTNSDVVHECNSGNEILDQEDVLVIGNWEDYTGSDSNVNPAQMRAAGTANKLQYTRTFIEDCAHQGEFTVRGNKKAVNRQRQHLEFIDLKKECGKAVIPEN